MAAMARDHRPLERGTVEAYIGIACGIFGAFVTNPLLKAILLVVAAAMLLDVVRRSQWTIQWPVHRKLIGFVIVLAIVGVIARPILTDIQQAMWTPAPPTIPTPQKQDEPPRASLVAECGVMGMLPIDHALNWQVIAIRLDKAGKLFSTGFRGASLRQAGYVSDDTAVFSQLCKITNYGTVPIFNLRMSAHVDAFEVIQDPDKANSRSTGKEPKMSTDAPVWINKIDPGPNSAESFAIANLTPFFLRAWIPTEVSAAPLGAPESKPMALAQPNQAGVRLPLLMMAYEGQAN
jgi:hypothetical protein